MDKETAWAMYFAGIAALRFHPKNHQFPTAEGTAIAPAYINRELDWAAYTADKMTEYHSRRFPWHGSDPSSAPRSADSAAWPARTTPTAPTQA